MTRRVLLIRPLCTGTEPEFAEPLGIERLAGYLRAHGTRNVWVFDRRLYAEELRRGLRAASDAGFWEDVTAAFEDMPPDVVGVSLMTQADLSDARRILSRVQALWPAAELVAGGLFVTTSAQEAARQLPSRVGLVAGEGEARLLEMATGTQAAGSLDPDQWALPYRPDLERYARLGCAVGIQTSRGCPGRCAFCATPQLPSGLRQWTARDLALVVDEMELEAKRLSNAGLPAVFNFVDDDFGPLERLEDLAAEVRRRGLVVSFSCEMRLASLVRQTNLTERLTALRHAGLCRVFVGVESLNPVTLTRWHKHYDVERLPYVVAAFRATRISFQAGYILWHAHQTLAGALHEVVRLHEWGLFTCGCALSRLIVFEGCELAPTTLAHDGFEALSPEAQRFYEVLKRRLAPLHERWVRAAVAEPYAAAATSLGFGSRELDALRQELCEVNEAAFNEFLLLACKYEGDDEGELS